VRIGDETIMQMQHMYRQGLKKTQIARRLDIDRKTVAKYLKDPHRKQSPQVRSSILDPYKPYIQHRLRKWPELSAARLCREISEPRRPENDPDGLLASVPYQGSERTVRRHVAEIRPQKKREYRPIETLPGEQAQVDWGHVGHIMVEGKRKPLYAFSFVLSYSRIRYVRFTTSQDMLNFLDCHRQALRYIGGVPERILYDNCKTVVSDRVGSVISFNNDLIRFATQYNFKAEACWVSDPESKGKVENSIKYVKRDFVYSRELDDVAVLNEEVLQWCDEVANEKWHQSTREVPSDRMADEKRALVPLPDHAIPVFMEVERTVRKDATFSFETNQYSVPSRYAQGRVKVLVFVNQLEVYSGGEQIAVHNRCHERGQLIIEDEHYGDRPVKARKRRSKLQAKFEALGPNAPPYLRGLARQRTGKLREQARQILDLRKEYSDEHINDAMARAAAFEKYSYDTVKNILQKRATDPRSLPDDPRARRIKTPYRGPQLEIAVRSLEEYARLLEVKD
jgi:transposase